MDIDKHLTRRKPMTQHDQILNHLRQGKSLTVKSGDRFSFLTVITRDQNDARRFIVRCVCGKTKSVSLVSLKYAVRPTKSCGCMRIKLLSAAQKKHGHSVKLKGTPEFRTYIAWQSMIWRCHNKNRSDYPRYGGRGIGVCERWSSYENFLSDVGLAPIGMSLGRKDNDAGYSPENCEWQTAQKQANSRSTNRLIKAFGKTQTISEWSRETGIRKDTLRRRIEMGWSIKRVLTDRVRS